MSQNVSGFACRILGLVLVSLHLGCASMGPQGCCSMAQHSIDPSLYDLDQIPDPTDSPIEWIASKSKKQSWVPEWKNPWSKKTSRTSYARNKPSNWDKFKRSNKQFWAKTAEVLDPYPDTVPASSNSSSSSSSSSGFSSWFKREEPKKIESVQDWLSQPRVGN
jgi:hypothetical protein